MSSMIWFGILLRIKKKNKNLDTTIMKAKYALIALLAISFYGCDDNTAGLGLNMFPENDQNINGKLSTFDVTTKSVETGRIYAKTNIGYVGKFTDETFGTYKAGFLAEMNCPQGLTFPKVYKETVEGGKPVKGEGILLSNFDNAEMPESTKKLYHFIKSGDEIIGNCRINIYLNYSSYFGDSLTACRLSVFELNQNLSKENAYYTDINPESFYDNSGLLGTKAYTAIDLSNPDYNTSSYYPGVGLALNKSVTEDLGKRIFEASNQYGSDFYKHFQDIFKGIYVKSDYGDGTVLYVDYISMDVVSAAYVTDSITGLKLKAGSGKDSIAYTGRSFIATREVIQANQLSNDKEAIQERIDEENCTYLKSPAGIFTQATLPISDIANELEGDTLNAVKLTFTNYNQSSDKKFGMTIPSRVMLIRKSMQDSFFKDNKLTDNISSYLAGHSSNTNQYVFSNITKLITSCITEKETARQAAGNSWNEEQWLKDNPDWNKVVLIPVLVTDDGSNNTTGQSNIISVQHDLKPGYVRLKGGLLGETNDEYKLKLEVISTDFNVN